MMLKYIKDFLFFLLIFSFFNDNLVVDIAGENGLKTIFAVFFIVHLPDMIIMTFKPNPHIVVKSFYIFLILMIIVMLSTIILYSQILLIDGIMNILSIYVAFVYVVYYRDLDKLLYFLWTAMMVSAISSLFNEPISVDTFRTSGGTIDPNRFAGQLLATAAATVYLYIKNKNLLFLLSTLVLFSYAILYAGSRTSILVAVALILYIVTVRFGFVFKKIFSLRGLAVLLILAGIASQINFSKMEAVLGMQERAKETRTAETRFASWNAGAGMVGDNFFVGVGQDRYDFHTLKYAREYMDEGSLAPHNILLKLLAENGIFVFLSFLVFLFLLFRSYFSEIQKSDYFWISIMPVGMILMQLTLNDIYAKFFWLTLALLANVILIMNNKKEQQ